jgi:hypothetical protein
MVLSLPVPCVAGRSLQAQVPPELSLYTTDPSLNYSLYRENVRKTGNKRDHIEFVLLAVQS